MRRLVLLALFTCSLALAACGGSDSSSAGSEQENASPATAHKEVGETRDALNAALATYKKGDKAAANEQVAEAYVSHFEEVEGPLGDVDPELNEKLEEAISTELRADIGKESVKNIKARVEELKAELATAKQKLEQ